MPSSPLKLISSMAARELLAELVSGYHRKTGQEVTTDAAGGIDVAKRVQADEAVDIVVLANNVIDKLIAAGKLLVGSRADLVQSGVAIAVRAGAPRPDVADEEAVKRAVLAAKTLSFSTGPSGIYLEKTFARWGILETLRSRILVPPPGVPVGSLVATGEVELGFQQLSELQNLIGIDVVGPLPPAIQIMTIFSGGVTVSCARPEAARAVLDFMTTAETAEIKQRHGMQPA